MLTTKGIPCRRSAPRRELSDYTGCVTDELPASSLVLSMRGSCTELTEAAVSRAAALVSPSEAEYEYIQAKVRELMEEGRGETIMELGAGEDTEGITEEEMQASVATLK